MKFKHQSALPPAAGQLNNCPSPLPEPAILPTRPAASGANPQNDDQQAPEKTFSKSLMHDSACSALVQCNHNQK
jgi:hypothetical protein